MSFNIITFGEKNYQYDKTQSKTSVINKRWLYQFCSQAPGTMSQSIWNRKSLSAQGCWVTCQQSVNRPAAATVAVDTVAKPQPAVPLQHWEMLVGSRTHTSQAHPPDGE